MHRPEPADLAASKLAAGRDKDWPFVAALLKHHIVDRETVRARVALLPIEEGRRDRLDRWLAASTHA